MTIDKYIVSGLCAGDRPPQKTEGIKLLPLLINNPSWLLKVMCVLLAVMKKNDLKTLKVGCFPYSHLSLTTMDKYVVSDKCADGS